MERKARLLSPLLVLAMLISLVAGAMAVVVNTQQALANGPVLEVEITTPSDGGYVDVCQNFAVKATITNTGDATAEDVTANITIDGTKVEWVAGGSSTGGHEQDLGDIEEECSVEVVWTLHCRNAGVTDITVTAWDTNSALDEDTVNVNQLLRVEIIQPAVNCAGYEVCPSQSFTLRATVTNTGDDTVTLNETGAVSVEVSDENASVTAGPTPDPSGLEIDPGESKTFTWTLHCDARSDDIIWVEVYDDAGDLIGYDEYAFHQRGLMVDIVMPEPGDVFCVSNDFYVNAVVTNTCGDTIYGVNATISGVDPYGGSSYNAELENASETFTKVIGDIPGKLSRDVMWKLHCTAVGSVTIGVAVTGTTAFGEAVSDSDSVTVYQGTGLTVEIVEPPFDWSPDGYTVCVCQTFVVKAHISNIGCDIDATSVTVSIAIGAGASLIPEESNKASIEVGGIDVGEEVIVGWTLHCDEPGRVLITVSASSSNGLSGSDSVYVTQGDPTVPDLGVYIISPSTSTKVSTDCNDVFTVTAVVVNPSCATLLNTFAELMYECGPGTIYVSPVEKVKSLGNISGPGSALVSWTVECTGAGDVTLWVEAWAGNHTTHVASNPVTIHQLDFMVDFLPVSVQALQVSTCQQFTVTARFENNDGELVEVDAILDYSRIGAVLATGSTVEVSYHKSVTPANPDGVPDPTKPPQSIPALDTVPYGEGLDYGLSTVELSRICKCCYALVTWTLECVGAVDGNLEVWAQTAGGIFLDGDSVSVDQQWKAHLVAGLEAFAGRLSDKTLVTVADDTFTICQYFTVVATVTNIGEATATNVNVQITVTGDVTPSGTLTMAMAAGNVPDPFTIPGGQSGKVWWELHCDGAGDVTVDVTHLSGIDYNTGLPILAGNIDVLCELTLHQVVGELEVIIVQPATCDTFTLGQEFTVKALVTNLGEDAVDVSAYINFTTTRATLIEDEPAYPATKSLGTIDPGRTHEVAWVLRCTARGDVTIIVYATAAGLGAAVASNTVVVHQIGPSEITCRILSPCDDETTIATIATSQEFALTVLITNLEASAPVTIYYLELEIDKDSDTGLPFADIVAGPVPNTPFTLAGGQSKIVTWTLHAVSATYEPCSAHEFEICVYVEGIDDMGFTVWTRCCVDVDVYAAAHLVVDIIAPADGTTVTVSDTFTVTAIVTNTGWADAWEVSATLSVFPEGSARVTSGGYTKYNIGPLHGTLAGYGQNGSATVSWELHCKQACNSTITVTAAGKDEVGYHMQKEPVYTYCGDLLGMVIDGDLDGYYGCQTVYEYQLFSNPGAPIPDNFIEPDSITVKQVEAASLVVANISYPTQVDVCQNFTVDAVVRNTGQATAVSVVATIHISENLDASLAAGTANKSLGNIAGGGFALVSWLVHCDGASSGAIAVSADGTNTDPAVAANGSVIQIAPPVPQPCLEVELDAPAEVTVEQSYYVTAVVSNPCDGQACDVVGTISIKGNAALASGETATYPFGCIAAGDSATWSWKVNCTDVGGVNITVSVQGTGTNRAIDGVAVRQVVFSDILEALESIQAEIVGVRGDIASGVATISTGLGTIQTSLSNLNATVTSIDADVATIVTSLGTLNGTVADISDGVATIVTDLGTVKADVSGIKGDTGTLKSRSIWTLPILILVAIGAIALIVGVAIVASRRRPVPVVIERKGEE